MTMDYLERLSHNRGEGVEHAASVKPNLTDRHKSAKLGKSESTLPREKRPDGGKNLSPETKMAAKKGKKKSKSRKGGRLTKAEIKKAGGIKQAWAARKGKTKAKSKHSVKKTSRKKSTKHSKAKRPKAKASRKKSRRAAPKMTHTTRTVIQKLPGHTTHIAVVPVPAAARRSKPRKKGRKKAKKSAHSRKGSRKASHKGAMENPMTGVELFVGGITGLFGFASADVLDRLLATHALTDKGSKGANGNELYADNPATTGPYAGLFNATAICAPMDVTRWLAGLGMAAVPLTIAHFIGAPTGRAALQFFGFGAGVRIVGKGLTDLVAAVTKTNPVGQRLYDGEMRAAALKSGGSNNPELASLPSAGLGRLPKGDCPNCAKKPMGAGYPSMPREVAAQPQQPPPSPPAAMTPPPPPPPPPVAQAPTASTLLGVPRPRRAPGAPWGARDDIN